MKLIIDIDDNVFTRLFDNGVDTSSEDRKVIDRAVRNGTPYAERPQGEIIKELWNCRNELCLKCERYKEAWKGACKDCRYNFKNMEKWKEGSDEVADDKHL